MTYRRGLGPSFQRALEDKEGNVYYVRLKTPLGIFYKLGFTSMSSVKARLAFQNRGHEQQIDYVFVFMESKNALSIEQTLHSHFQRKAAFPIPEEGMPFFENGQSELYIEDILDMDGTYTKERAAQVEKNIIEARMRSEGNPEAAIKEALERRADSIEMTRGIALLMSWPIDLVVWCWTRIHNALFDTKKASDAGSIEELKQALREHARFTRYLKNKTLREQVEKLAEQEKVANMLGEALAAMKCRDLVTFERLVNMDRVIYNVAEAMTPDFVMRSDYMVVANNLCLMKLLDRMSEQDSRDVLLGPVQDSYKALLRHWILRHELLSDQLILPPDEIYHVADDGTTHEVPELSSVYFGPAVYLKELGTDWSLPKAVNRSGDGWAEFDIHVQNPITGFSGDLVVHATLLKESEQIELDFRTFPDLYRQALTQFRAHERACNPDVSDPLEGFDDGTQIGPGEVLKRTLRYPDLRIPALHSAGS